MAAKFEIYKHKSGEFHWRPVYMNGRVIAKSGEGYDTKANAISDTDSVKETAPQRDCQR
jgi:uncharacterized protein YegP (UPF0339 family)